MHQFRSLSHATLGVPVLLSIRGLHTADGNENDALAAVIREYGVHAVDSMTSSSSDRTQWQLQQLTCRRNIVQQWR
jgi:hypothetical protein